MKLNTNLSFSGAMRRGHEFAMRQVIGTLSDHEGGACANGHALLGGGAKDCDISNVGNGTGPSYDTIKDTWPIAGADPGPCPACGCGLGKHTLMSQVWHLNDYHKWTVDQIADYVQTLENAAKPVAKDAVDASVE